MLLPQKLGPLTLMRKLGTDGVADAFVGILDDPPGQHVVVRRLLPFISKDAARLSAVESRVSDLTAVRHPTLVPVKRLDHVADETLVIEDHIDAVSLGDVIAWCRKESRSLPHNVFLNLATQICNGLEALHGRPGKQSGEEHVLHLALSPDSVLLTPEGRLLVGEYGLVRSPTSLPSSGGADAAARRLAHISPEQTHPDQKLTPASDIFSLGSLLFELLMLEPLFRRDSSLQTIHAVRKAEVSGQLQRVKKVLPGLDKVLYRALSLNPRHRYQRAFVLREDIRGLMAGYSFTRVSEETSAFLAPLFAARAASRPQTPTPVEDAQDNTGALLREAAGLPEAAEPRPEDTLAYLRGVSQDTLVPTFPGSGSMPSDPADGLDDDLDGLEMWSEVPTTVDPTDSSAIPVANAAAADADDPSVPQDHTTWIRRDHGPPSNAFESDEATDVARDPSTSPVSVSGVASQAEPSTPASTKRQLSPDELAALGMKVRPTPPPAPQRPSTDPPQGEPSSEEAQQSGSTASETADASDLRAATTMAMMLEDDPAADPSPADPSPADLAPDAATTRDQAAQPDSRSSYRPPGASAPTPTPKAAPQVQARKLQGLSFDQDEVTAVTDDEAEDDLNWKPRGSGRGLAIAGSAIAIFVVVLLCGGVAVVAGQGVVSGWITGSPVASNEPGLTPLPPAPDPTPEPAEPAVAPEPADTTGQAVVASNTPESKREVPPPRPIAEPARSAPATTPARTAPVRTAPEPRPIAATAPEPSRPITPTRSTPAPTRTSSIASAAAPASTARTTATTRDPDPPRLTTPDDSSVMDTAPAAVIASTPDSLESLATRARSGRLSAADRLTLEMTERADPDFTRAHAILYEDAKARGDGSGQRKYLDTLLGHAENKYNPVFLTEGAHMDIADQKFDRALARATTAERHWGRLPSELVFSRKTMIYEAKAAAWQGKFYASGGSDLGALGQAIDSWEKYQRHVTSKSRADLSQIADQQLTKLYDARRRLE